MRPAARAASEAVRAADRQRAEPPQLAEPLNCGANDPHRPNPALPPTDRVGKPLRHDRGGHRGDPRGAHGRRLRRRRPRERGRPRDGHPVRHARGDQLHGQGGPRLDLPGAHPRALRGARSGADDRQERVRSADPLHGHDRGARGRHHRRLRARPRPHHAGRRRSRHQARRPRAARARQPAEGQGRRRARAHRAHRGQRRPRAPRRPDPVRRDLRDHERGRLDGARARPRRVLHRATG